MDGLVVEALPGRGFGVATQRFLRKGQLILIEEMFLQIWHTGLALGASGEWAIKTARLQDVSHISLLGLLYFQQASALQQAHLLSLHCEQEEDLPPAHRERLARVLEVAMASAFIKLDREIASQVVRTINCNGMGVQVENQDRSTGLFLFSSRINHSCAPNAISHHRPDHKIVYRALRDITAGEELTVMYYQAALFRSTAERRSHLESRYLFFCDCVRCCLPRERAVCCPQCPSGAIFLTSLPSDSSDSSAVPSLPLCSLCGVAISLAHHQEMLALEEEVGCTLEELEYEPRDRPTLAHGVKLLELYRLMCLPLAEPHPDSELEGRDFSVGVSRFRDGHWLLLRLHELLACYCGSRRRPELEAAFLLRVIKGQDEMYDGLHLAKAAARQTLGELWLASPSEQQRASGRRVLQEARAMLLLLFGPEHPRCVRVADLLLETRYCENLSCWQQNCSLCH